MRRTVSAAMDLTVSAESDLVLAVSVTPLPGLTIDEHLVVELDGAPLPLEELTEATGTRLHLAHATPGAVRVRYDAVVDGKAPPAPVEELDLIAYRRPSRYCESDQLLPTAQAEFEGLSGKTLLDSVSSWVGEQLSYIPGSSKPTDGATETLLARQGVCRDYAHLVVALLRALDVPARLVSVYAPQLDPMDFHAVVEALVEGRWVVVDSTRLAPRAGMVRMATGRDATDTAFLTNTQADIELLTLDVDASADAPFDDDPDELLALS